MNIPYLPSLLAFCILCCASCEQVQKRIDKAIQVKKPFIIIIQPLGDMPVQHVRHVQERLKKVYPHVRIKQSIELPSQAYYRPRKRYRADSLIRFLKDRTAEGNITIGMTSSDISHTTGSSVDYGIMGLGYQPGKSCVVSTFRLAKKNIPSQFFKLCLHELGHTQGLPHCPEKTCYMRDAEGGNHFDEQTAFCKTCREYLESRNWHFESPTQK